MKSIVKLCTRRDFLRESFLAGAVFGAAPAFLARVLLAAGAKGDAWYDKVFSLVTAPHLMTPQDLKAVRADAYRAGTLWGGWYGSWYVDWQMTTKFYRFTHDRIRNLFRWNVMYYDGGEVGDFVLFLDTQGKIAASAWDLPDWKGADKLTPYWFGMESFYAHDNPFPFVNAAARGLRRPTYPDGREPTSVYEVLGRRSVYGKQEFDYSANLRITDARAQEGGLDKLTGKQHGNQQIIGRNGWITGRLITSDYTNPELRDYEASDMARLTREVQPDGWHVDNYGDVNLFNPVKTAFGAWAEHTFLEFLRERCPPEQLSALGVKDLDSFDMPAYVRVGRDLSLGKTINEQFDGEKWKNDPLWKAYQINLVLRSADFHTAKYDAVKATDRQMGTDRLFSGNTIPLFAGHSFVEGKLDVAHFEWPSWRSYHPKRRPMGLPPDGRSGYITRLARRISSAGYSIISLYVPVELTGETHKNLFLAQAFEALPNRTLLDFNEKYLDQRSSGTVETANIFNGFVDSHRDALSRQDFVTDVAVLFDQWADVAATTASALDMDEFFNEYGGWCDYLTLQHHQWDVITTTSLTMDNLSGVPVLVLPSAITLDDAQIALIGRYLDTGGKVIATGGAGERHGPEGFLLKRDRNALDALAGRPGLIRITDKPGAAYWLHRDKTAAATMGSLLSRANLSRSVQTSAPESVSVTLFRRKDFPGLMLDISNHDFWVQDDQFHPAPSFNVTLRLPDDLASKQLTVDVYAPGAADSSLAADRMTVGDGGKSLSLQIESLAIYETMWIRATA